VQWRTSGAVEAVGPAVVVAAVVLVVVLVGGEPALAVAAGVDAPAPVDVAVPAHAVATAQQATTSAFPDARAVPIAAGELTSFPS
jgi:hypothetical protein